MISAKEALEKLKAGNAKYVENDSITADVSQKVLTNFAENGQQPYAIIITCSDSRVIPEEIFNASIGDIFTIRVAGNVIGDHQLGSVEYAADHLGSKLVVVLGHTKCGAVGAALEAHGISGYVKTITDEIGKAIGSEKDGYKASALNAKHSADVIRNAVKIDGLEVVSAVYQIEDGKVNFDI